MTDIDLLALLAVVAGMSIYLTARRIRRLLR